MDKELLTAIFGLLYVAIFGFLTARSSNRRDPVYGGIAVKIFHLLGAGFFVAILPTVLTSAFILRTGHLIVPLVLSAVVVSYASLLVFAALERPFRQQALRERAQRGWTEKDARTSDL